jgi:hypothetical protein
MLLYYFTIVDAQEKKDAIDPRQDHYHRLSMPGKRSGAR